ncbi:MAG: hypothetical protein ACREPA_04550 [Candidatus Dormibacteraceae bacterium]
MNEDVEMMNDREKARVRARERKLRGPAVVADNPGLKRLQLQLALRRRATRRLAR